MGVQVTQTCDKNGETRPLDVEWSSVTDKGIVNPFLGGWRILQGKHICPECLKKFLEGT